MVGATPQLATAVWVGTADNTSAIFNEWGGNMYGSATPAKIWKDVMDSAHQGKEVIDFPTATPVYWGINPYSGGSGLGGSNWSGGYSTGYGSGNGYGYGGGYSSGTGSNTGTGTDGGAASTPAPAPAPAPAPVPAPAVSYTHLTLPTKRIV